MEKLTTENSSAAPKTRPATPSEKKTLVWREILAGETERRQIKSSRLRKVRLKKEANEHA